MGTPSFSCPTLKALVASGFNVIGVFTQSDRPKGRGLKMQPSPVKVLAQSLQIPFFQPLNLKEGEIGTLWSELTPDGVVVVAYGFILPAWILHGPSLGCINLHASLLPLYRGAAPINWAIMNGEKETGVTTMLMDEGMDTGPIFLQAKTPINAEDTAGSLYERLSLMGAELMVKTLREYEKGLIKPKKQPGEVASIAPKLEKGIGRIDWSKDHHTLCNLIRGINPAPGAFSFLDGRMMKIWFALPLEGDAENAQPGMICGFDTNMGLIVQTGKGRLAVKEIQPESKKRMSAQALVSGYQTDLIGKVLTQFPE